MQLLTFVFKTDSSLYPELATKILRNNPDGLTRFAILRHLFQAGGKYEEAFNSLSSEVAVRYGDRTDLYRWVFSAIEQCAVHLLAESRTSDPELRLFIALLATQDKSEMLARVVRQVAPDVRPEDTVAGWLRRLADKGVLSLASDGPANEAAALLCMGTPQSEVQRSMNARYPGRDWSQVIEGLKTSRLLWPLFQCDASKVSALV